MMNARRLRDLATTEKDRRLFEEEAASADRNREACMRRLGLA